MGLSHDIVDAAQAKLKVALLVEKDANAQLHIYLRKHIKIHAASICQHSACPQALAEEEQKASAIIQESFLQLLDNFISHLLNPDSVVPNRYSATNAMIAPQRANCDTSISLQDSLVLFAQQYSMQNCFLCLQTPSLRASAAVPSASDDRPCQPLTSLPAAATASGIGQTSHDALISFL